MLTRLPCSAAALLCFLLFSVQGTAAGKDFVLIVGGGPDPSSDQISIEQNVEFFCQTQESREMQREGNLVLFASGPGDEPDVCFNHGVPLSPAVEILAMANNANRNLALDYRHHGIAEVKGPATKSAILDTLKQLSQELTDGDRLLLYFTGHGAKGANAETSSFQTWGKQKLEVAELAKALDQFRPEVPVMVVMVQCYSGAFANLIFGEGDPAKDLVPHRRAGFFSTLSTRTAAGCTPDINRADYQDYSTYFFAAIGGKNRLGDATRAVDVDGDGAISFAEAHAHVLTESPTIDVPVKSSDRFLRRYAVTPTDDAARIAWNSDYSKLLAAAGPAERTVLETLTERLGLTGEDRVAEAHRLSEEIDRRRGRGQRQIEQNQRVIKQVTGKISQDLQKRWPVLRDPWHQFAQDLLSNRRQELDQIVEQNESYAEWQRLRERVARDKEKDLADEKHWAQLRRVVYAAESVALAENLKLGGDLGLQDAYARLTELEAWPLVAASAAEP